MTQDYRERMVGMRVRLASVVLGILGMGLVVGLSPVMAAPQAAPSEQALIATVTQQYGALVRNTPDSDGSNNVLYTAACGESFEVVGGDGDWVQVVVPPERRGNPNFPSPLAWIGGARVWVGPGSMISNCADATVFPILSTVEASVASGCLSLRYSPSRTPARAGSAPSSSAGAAADNRQKNGAA
jgi:hypothetical protein